MLKIKPLTLKQANELVEKLHRHHKKTQGHRFSLGVEKDGVLVGAVIVGRPVSRNCDQYLICEVTRLVTDGTKNACSFLYSAAARVAREMGFEKIQTYILESEPGTSLIASGWVFETVTTEPRFHKGRKGGERRVDSLGKKHRWAKVF